MKKLTSKKSRSASVKQTVAVPHANLDPISSLMTDTPNPVSVPGAAPVPVPYVDPSSSDSQEGSKIKGQVPKSKKAAPKATPAPKAKPASKRAR